MEKGVKKNKILHIENAKNITGSFRALINTINKSGHKYESILALPEDNNNKTYAERKGIKCVTFPFSEIRKKIKSLMLYFPLLIINTFKVHIYCKKHNVQILHNNDHYNLVPLILKFFLKKRYSFIVHVRLLPSTYNYQLYNIYRWLNKKYADKIIAVSNAVADAYKNPKKLSVIYDEHDIKESYPAIKIKNQGVLKILYLSNFIRGKGQNFALDALKILIDEKHFNSFEVHFYGNTMQLHKNEIYKEELKTQAKALGISNYVFFHNEIEEIEPVYKAHDLCLMFSESESFSMITMEAMFYGLPVIATDCGGPKEIIDNLENGILVANRDINEMANAIENLCRDYLLREKFNIEGRRKIEMLLNQPKSFFDIVDETIL